MLFSADLANLIFYCAQQLGVTLGVGAETIMLAAYLISMRDGVVDEKETQYARAIKRAMSVALILIIISGIGITVLHGMAGEGAVIFTPAYLFKWLLVLLVIALTLLRKASPLSIVEGVIGGTWYALFLVHILAPVTGWLNLGTLYAVWLVGFVVCWEALVFLRRDKKGIVKKVELPKNPVPAPEVKITAPKPEPEPVFKPKITLGPDLPQMVAVPVPKAPPVPPPAPPSIPKKEEKITLMPPVAPQSSMSMPSPTFPPSPAGKVTDTPFLPKVPPLQPIPTAPQTMPAVPVAGAPAAPAIPPGAPITTTPGGTSTPAPAPTVPLVQEGLSAVNVMPKNPADTVVKK